MNEWAIVRLANGYRVALCGGTHPRGELLSPKGKLVTQIRVESEAKLPYCGELLKCMGNQKGGRK